MCEQAIDQMGIKDLEEIALVWKARGKEMGGANKKVSELISKLLKLIKMSDKVKFDSLTNILTTALCAVDAGPDVVKYMDDYLTDEFWTELEGEGMLNLYNEDGSQVSIADLGKLSLPVQMSLGL
jgi:hypothetical protein